MALLLWRAPRAQLGKWSAARTLALVSASVLFGLTMDCEPAKAQGSSSHPPVINTSQWTLGAPLIESSDSTGTPGDGSSFHANFSPDGTLLLFYSSSRNLVPGATNGLIQLYVKNVLTGQVRLVSADALGNEGNQNSFYPDNSTQVRMFSPDGTKVVFESAATNLVMGTSGMQIFLKDLTGGGVTLVSANMSGVPGDNSSTDFSFSPDGTKVVFDSTATNLVQGASGQQIYIKDLVSQNVTLVSTDMTGNAGNSFSYWPAFSPDGNEVGFASNSTNLVTPATFNQQIFVKNLTTQMVTLVSADNGGNEGNSQSFFPMFSPDGSKVLFNSSSTNLLLSGPTNGHLGTYVKDLNTQNIVLVSTDATGAGANNDVPIAMFSADGTKVGFYTPATNLLPAGTSNYQVFVKDLLTGAITLASTDAGGMQGNGLSTDVNFSPDNTALGFDSTSNNFGVPPGGPFEIIMRPIFTPFGAVVDSPSATTLTTAGQLSFSDADVSDTHTVSVTTQSGDLGALTATVSQDTTGTGTGGVIRWNYQVNEPLVHALTGSSADSFLVTLTDSQGCTATATVAITDLPSNFSVVNAGAAGAPTSTTSTCPTIVPPSIAEAFIPNSIRLNVPEIITLNFTITNPAANTVALTGVAFSDTLPTGVSLLGLGFNTCGGTPSTTGTSISLTGGTIAVNSSCTVQLGLDGSGAAAGSFVNTTGAVTSTNGGTGNTATDTLTVVAPPSVALAFSPTSIPLNGTSTLTFTITNPPANTVALFMNLSDVLPSGLVVANSSTTVCGGPLQTSAQIIITLSATIPINGQCQFSVPVTGAAVGTFNNTPFVTSQNGGVSNFVTATLSVISSATTTILTSSQNPSGLGQSVTFTATVSAAAPGAGTPTGKVTFLDGGSPIGTGTLVGGIATFTTSALGVGSHTITATYSGDATFNGSTGSLTGNPQVVNKSSSTTVITSSSNPSVFGQSVTFTATVSAVTPGAGTPTGTVTFLDGGNSIGTGTLTGGIATFTTSALAVGSHTITTTYAGDANFNGSTGSLTGNPQVVSKAATSTTLTSSANPSILNQSVTFTATVSVVAPGAGSPTGTITFSEATTTLATVPLNSGTATFSTSALAVNSHSVTAAYSGDANFNASSGSLTQKVSYSIVVLYDQSRAVNGGATFPIKVALYDVNGVDVSSSTIVLNAKAVTMASGFSGTPDSPGNSNPDNDFRFDGTLGTTGGYIFNLSTGGLTPGTYSLQFTAGADPLLHAVMFGVAP